MKSYLAKIFSGYHLEGSSREKSFYGIDWILFLSTFPLLAAGLVTMNSFTESSQLFTRQIIWILVCFLIFFVCSFIDFRFLRKTWVSVTLFVSSTAVLGVLFLIGNVTKGARSWFDLGFFSVEPAELIKLALIIILSKYFSRRHIEIANVKHVVVSGLYAFIIFFLILIHPDFGSAIIVFLIWLGMVLVSGISKKHLSIMALVGVLAFAGLWSLGFKDYQKDRIKNFIHPLADIHGTGYNAYQSTVAVGSGQLFGKGVGYGTQSRLKFLPEYETDFVFAAYAEEWGFLGVALLFIFFGILVWRIIRTAMSGATNFEILFGAGMAIFFIVHVLVNIGMNIQLLPVTGTTLPFLSYGGTHLLTEFLGLGILMGMRRYSRVAHKDATKNEFIGPA